MASGDALIVLVGTVRSGCLSRLAEFERLRQIELARGPEIVVALPPSRELGLDFLPAIDRERDHTAPRSPRQSFKKSSKR